MADGGDPDRSRWPLTPLDRLRDMVRTVHSHLRSRGQRQPSPRCRCGGRRASTSGSRPPPAALAELALAPGRTVARAVERLEGCLGRLIATPAWRGRRPPGSTT